MTGTDSEMLGVEDIEEFLHTVYGDNQEDNTSWDSLTWQDSQGMLDRYTEEGRHSAVEVFGCLDLLLSAD